MGTINILIVDDHQILVDGVIELLHKSEVYEVIATALSGKEAFEQLSKHSRQIQLVITDINLPDMKGWELTKECKRRYPQIKVVALSMHEEKYIINDALKAGVDGYVLKKATHEELVGAIGRVLSGEVYVSPAVTKMLVDNVRNPSVVELLSDREKEIIALIVEEFTSRKIAEKLFISEKTVESHKTNIFRKTNTTTLVGITKFAIEHNLVN